MKVVDYLFDCKLTTYFIGKLIIIGCESFRIEDVDRVREKYVFDVEIVKHIYYNLHNPDEDLGLLIKDERWKIRRAVARQGYGLDVLIKDEDWSVREAVVRQGYGLDVLIKDENYYVRIAVAQQGYGLDVLINDKHWRVRRAVKEYLNNKK